MAAHSNRRRDLLELLTGIAIVGLILFIGSYALVRVDLTSEKRYTLTDATKDLVAGLDDVVYVKVYLDGELPADLRRLSRATRELLDEMRVHGPDKLEYSFVDPSASPDERTRREVYDQLQGQGLQYTSITFREKGAVTERIVFPGALITYRGKTIPLQLLKTQFRTPDADIVNRSINNLEYELASAIRQITGPKRGRIAFLEGHGELDDLQVMDLVNALGEQYDVRRVRINEEIGSLSDRPKGITHRVNKFDLVVVAKPDTTWPAKDLFILDQFVMNGGKVIWLVDVMNANLDSLRANQYSMAVPLDLGVEELLFNYGVRINADLLLDASCAPIELYTTPYGNQRKLERFPWYFEPVLIPQGAHPIVHNIDPVHMRFVSSMDTLATDSVQKTVLLTTSPYTRLFRNPVRIDLDVVQLDLGLEKSSTPSLPVAALLEGRFRSAFADRLLIAPEDLEELGYREWSPPTAQLVVSDGDVIANRVDRERGMFFTLGYDRYTRSKIYGNKEFLINAVNYLLDDQALISVRSRAIGLRKLDPERIVEDRGFWQVFNVGLPIFLGLLIGGASWWWRRRRYSRTR
ncbi:MAG: gliding motility-associated ABC transporter substrate-binding protein GldG [Flavobacteriales bacterium]|nr:gliding motility-associated ABC transporter substrate-binding protein GldG [Flavobacteriales bacterium]